MEVHLSEEPKGPLLGSSLLPGTKELDGPPDESEYLMRKTNHGLWGIDLSTQSEYFWEPMPVPSADIAVEEGTYFSPTQRLP